MDNESKIASVVIIVVSVAGFVSGYSHETYLAEASQLKEETIQLQEVLDRIENRALFLIEQTHDRGYECYSNEVEVTIVDHELRELNSTLGWDERDAYLRRITGLLGATQTLWSQVPLLGVYWHFNQTTSDLVITSEDVEGYDYNITYAQWQEYESEYVPRLGPLVDILSASESYGHFFSYDYIQALPIEMRPTNVLTGGETFLRIGTGLTAKAEFFFMTPVNNLQEEITSKLELANSLEAQAQRVSVGVSLTTIALVLVTAIGNKIDRRSLEKAIVKHK